MLYQNYKTLIHNTPLPHMFIDFDGINENTNDLTTNDETKGNGIEGMPRKWNLLKRNQ